MTFEYFGHGIVCGVVVGCESFVHLVALGDGAGDALDRLRANGWELKEGRLAATTEILEYLDGVRLGFSVFPKPLWGTPFQRRVWCITKTIPYGATITYGRLALLCGGARAVRAVANALRANPVPIIVPCHRVIRSDGSVGGFAAGEEIKRRLLELERMVLARIAKRRG